MDASVLSAQILKAREFVVTVGGLKFTVRRPAAMTFQFASISGDTEKYTDRLMEHVIGWDGVRECDLLANGASDQLEFDTRLFKLFVMDRTDVWDAIFTAIIKARDVHDARIKALQGNS